MSYHTIGEVQTRSYLVWHPVPLCIILCNLILLTRYAILRVTPFYAAKTFCASQVPLYIIFSSFTLLTAFTLFYFSTLFRHFMPLYTFTPFWVKAKLLVNSSSLLCVIILMLFHYKTSLTRNFANFKIQC